MNAPLDRTHDPAARSWVAEANDADAMFPIQNLPFGIFRRRAGGDAWRGGIAIGDRILDLAALAATPLVGGDARDALRLAAQPTLNALMAQGRAAASELRAAVFALLADDDARSRVEPLLVAASAAEMALPATIGDYTDFYASIEHATTVGALFRPDNPLMPNYRYVPIAYHGRASSIVVDGTAVRRPAGQIRPDPNAPPLFAPSRRLDYELELGFFIAGENALGEPVPVGAAADRFFGCVLLNDWSGRDIQAWEYQPLGPFLGKNFASTISPWIVTADALAPFHVPARPIDPAPLPYLASETDRARGGLSITVEVALASERMRAEGLMPLVLGRARVASMYWTLAQMIAHHTSGGCNLRAGDLLGSGTISNDAMDARGSLLERTAGGKTPLRLPTGEERTFLADGDEVTLRARAERPGARSIGFGCCRGTIVPAAAPVRPAPAP